MYAATMVERLAATKAKLEATERLLAVEQKDHEITKRGRDDARKSHYLQQQNTKAFFESLKAAEAKLKKLELVLQGEFPLTERQCDGGWVHNGRLIDIVRAVLSDD